MSDNRGMHAIQNSVNKIIQLRHNSHSTQAVVTAQKNNLIQVEFVVKQQYPIKPGDVIEMFYGEWTYSCELLGINVEKALCNLKIKSVVKMTTRRQYVRLNKLFNCWFLKSKNISGPGYVIDVHIFDDHDLFVKSNKRTQGYKQSFVYNISGGGCKIAFPTMITRDDKVIFHFFNNIGNVVAFIRNVPPAIKRDDYILYQYGIEFVGINEKQREAMIAYIFEQLRLQVKK